VQVTADRQFGWSDKKRKISVENWLGNLLESGNLGKEAIIRQKMNLKISKFAADV
jgi:hypothetical protein